ncbi:MAG: hypothetical protein EOP48_25700 [Sphingobacteriales bacterium]|nr:MAG: hypothetical protein EOP48_25700 [Sphingobacteriales bacterium]
MSENRILKPKLILIGGGGHCKACIDVIEGQGKYEIIGILDVLEKQGTSILGYFVIGTDKDYAKFHSLGCHFLVTLGQIKSSKIRRRIFDELAGLKVKMATVISDIWISLQLAKGRYVIVMVSASLQSGKWQYPL